MSPFVVSLFLLSPLLASSMLPSSVSQVTGAGPNGAHQLGQTLGFSPTTAHQQDLKDFFDKINGPVKQGITPEMMIIGQLATMLQGLSIQQAPASQQQNQQQQNQQLQPVQVKAPNMAEMTKKADEAYAALLKEEEEKAKAKDVKKKAMKSKGSVKKATKTPAKTNSEKASEKSANQNAGKKSQTSSSGKNIQDVTNSCGKSSNDKAPKSKGPSKPVIVGGVKSTTNSNVTVFKKQVKPIDQVNQASVSIANDWKHTEAWLTAAAVHVAQDCWDSWLYPEMERRFPGANPELFNWDKLITPNSRENLKYCVKLVRKRSQAVKTDAIFKFLPDAATIRALFSKRLGVNVDIKDIEYVLTFSTGKRLVETSTVKSPVLDEQSAHFTLIMLGMNRACDYSRSKSWLGRDGVASFCNLIESQRISYAHPRELNAKQIEGLIFELEDWVK